MKFSSKARLGARLGGGGNFQKNTKNDINVSVMREKTQNNSRVGYSATCPMGRDMLRSEGVMELGGRGEGERRR